MLYSRILSRSMRLASHVRLLSTQNWSRLNLEFHENIGVITMTNGENKMDNVWLSDFTQALEEVEKNKSCTGVITTGEGKSYCKGVDSDWIRTLSIEEIRVFVENANLMMERLLLFPVPTLAAVNGDAYSLGGILSMCHDLRVINKERGRVFFTEVLNKFRLNPFFLQIMRVKLGGGKNLSDALILARKFSGDELFSNNMVHDSVPGHTVIGRGQQVIQSLAGEAGIPRESYVQMKKDVYQVAIEKLNELKKDQFRNRSLEYMTLAQQEKAKSQGY